MPIAEGSTIINAPVEVVFNYVSNANNLPTMLRANLITEVSNVEAKPGGGYRYVWQYKILGKSIRAYSESVEMIPCHTFVVKSTGGMDTISRWRLTPVPEGTQATFSIEYAMDRSVLSWLTGQFAANQVRYSVEVALIALKTLVHQEVGFDSARLPRRAPSPTVQQPGAQAGPAGLQPVPPQPAEEKRRRTVF